MEQEVILIEAQEITWEKGSAYAQGDIRVVFDDQILTGDTARWDGTKLMVDNGSYIRPEGVFAFDHAEVWVEEGTAAVYFSETTMQNARFKLDVLRIQEGDWLAEKGVFEPCICENGEPGMISFSASRLKLRFPGQPEAVVIVQGGRVQVFRVPILPVPYARIPLNPDRFRILFPEASYGSNGFAAAISGKGTIEGFTLQGGPRWRQDRGVRGEVLMQNSLAKASAVGGWDSLEQSWRGAAAWKGGVSQDFWSIASAGEWLSDSSYAEDYGVDWVARGVEWRDIRARTGLGPATLSGWWPDDGSSGTLLALEAAHVFGRAIQLKPWAAVSLYGNTEEAAGIPSAGLELQGERTVGPVYGQLIAAGEGGWNEDFFVDGAVFGNLALSLWGQSQGLTMVLRPGVEALWEDELLAGPSLGANFRMGRGVARFKGALYLDSDAQLSGVFRADASMKGLTGMVDIQEESQQLRLVLGGEPFALGLSSTHTEAVWWSGMDTTWHWRRLVLGGGVSGELVEPAWSGALGRVGYDDGCTSLIVSAGFAPDRSLPDLGMQLVLRQ